MIDLSEEQLQFLRRCGVDPAAARWETLDHLYEDLTRANRRDNLTRITDRGEFWNLHVLDSLSIGLALPEALRESLRIADVGCGAGFPLLPLAWANPAAQVVGIESGRKKALFIQREIAALGLANASVMCLQAREAGRRENLGGTFDLVLLRAVGSAGKLLRDCRGLLKKNPGAKMVFYKTPAAVAEELPLARREADKFGLRVIESEPFSLPAGAGERQFMLFGR